MNKLITLKHFTEKLQKSNLIPCNSLHNHSYKPFYSLSRSPSIVPKPSKPPLHCYSPTNYGFYSNPKFSKSFSSIPHLKGNFNTFLGSRLCFLRTQFPKFKPSPWSSNYKRKWSSWSHGYSSDNIVLGLIVANTAVFVLWRVLDRDFMYKNFMISLDNIKSGRVHTLITSAFSHIDMGHIASNMIGLYFFGSSIGRYLGPDYLLKLYFAGAVVGSIFYVVHHAFFANMFKKQGAFERDLSRVPGLGASGAVNAIMLLDIFLFPKATLMFDFFIPVPAILLGIYLIGQDVLRMVKGDQQISGSAHLGGAAVAAAAWLQLKKGRGFRF
ncbi:hypothetical protein KSS87_000012 [Heliosperma pusillum]|nr:hypothetical protein KSS87_000012 [Heliosperma pusillum]